MLVATLADSFSLIVWSREEEGEGEGGGKGRVGVVQRTF